MGRVLNLLKQLSQIMILSSYSKLQRYRFHIAVIAALLLLPQLDKVAKSAERQNVLLIMCDDLNCALGCYGDPIAKTPNIDALAASGVRFERAYCQFPLCGPSRNSMLTGLYPDATGILQNSQIFRQSIPEQRSVPQHLRLEHNYWTARIGKMYHYNVPNSIGTTGHDDPESWEWGINPAGCDRLIEQPNEIFSLQKGNFGGTLSWYASPRATELHTDSLVADAAVQLLGLAAQNRERPFFIAVGFYRPHTPYVAPQKYFELYPIDQIELPTNVEQDQQDIPPLALASQKSEQNEMTDLQRKQAIQAYRATISFADDQVGRVLKALNDQQLRNSTTIIFTSDHGYHLGEHGLWQKQSLFEESTRVPMIISSPNCAKAEVCRSPVGLIDVAPTVMELCDTQPNQLQGQSLVPMLNDVNFSGRGWSLSEVRRGTKTYGEERMGYSLRTPQWRYTLWNDGAAGHELYDHETDPKELINLAEDPAHAATVEQLSGTLHNAIAEFLPAAGRPIVNAKLPPPNLLDADY